MSRYLLESGAPDGYLLEDGTGVLLLDEGSGLPRLLFGGLCLVLMLLLGGGYQN